MDYRYPNPRVGVRTSRSVLGAIALFTIGLLFTIRQYILAPWQINPVDFLIRPIFLYLLPLTLISLLLLRRLPFSAGDGMLLGVAYLHGILALWFQTGWPPSQLTTSWEASYGQLLELEVLLYVYGLPMWCIFAGALLWEQHQARHTLSR